MKNNNTKYKREIDEFEYFLFEMSDVVERFVKEASLNECHLDFSLECIAELEKYLEGMQQIDDSTITRAGRFLGEVFRKNIGGKWELCLDSPRHLYFKLPVIAGYSNLNIKFCPTEIIRNFLFQKKRGLILKAIESNAIYKN